MSFPGYHGFKDLKITNLGVFLRSAYRIHQNNAQ